MEEFVRVFCKTVVVVIGIQAGFIIGSVVFSTIGILLAAIFMAF